MIREQTAVTVAQLLDALAGIDPAAVIATDYEGRPLAAVELRTPAEGPFTLRLRFAGRPIR